MNRELQGLQTITKQVAVNVHDYLYSAIKLPDQDKATLVAGILIALENTSFKNSYASIEESEEFIDSFMSAVKNSIKRFDGLKNHKDAIIANFDFIKANPNFQTKLEKDGKTYIALQMLVGILEKSIYRIAKEYPSYDILGEFYNEFTKYSGADQQQLGIVLTPHHIADFMSDLLLINENDVILDTCCGSGALPLTADAKTVAHNKIVGVEFNARMLSLTVANMMIRGIDCHLLNGDSWQESIMNEIKAQKPTKFIINPPYSQPGYPELGFIKRALDCLEVGGLGVAIVPMSCAFKENELRKEILDSHSLIASFTPHREIFTPVATETIVLLFKAHIPHNIDDKVFIASIEEDGFEKVRNQGRVDTENKWGSIKNNVLTNYRLLREEDGISVISKQIDSNKEWTYKGQAKALSGVEKSVFETAIRDYLIFTINNTEVL